MQSEPDWSNLGGEGTIIILPAETLCFSIFKRMDLQSSIDASLPFLYFKVELLES